MSVGYDLAGIQIGQGARFPRRHARRARPCRAAAGADTRALSKIPRPRLSDPHLRLADAVDLPRLPAGRNRGDRRASDRRGRPRRRRQAQPDAARPRASSIRSCTRGSATATSSSLSGPSPRTRPGARLSELVERLDTYASARGRGLGVKFSNTLVVENNRGFFPASEPQMYLSGPPLHLLAIALVARFRARLRRPPADLVLGRDRRGQLRRHDRPRPEARHRLQRLSQVRRLPARLALFRRAGQADGRGGREGHRCVRAESARSGRGRARRSRRSAQSAPPHAAPRWRPAAIRAKRPETLSPPGFRRRGC